MRILFVCTGNTCRSPMAQALTEKIAREKNWSLFCDSAGLAAIKGQAVSEYALAALEEGFGIRSFQHSAKSVTRAMAAEFDLVVAMTENHKRYLTQAFSCGEKTVTLPEEVGDPYGSDRKSYLACAKQIEKGLYALIEEGIIRESMP
ncbi:MAG: low molecular weight protein arginine phosphatase [Clostridia bacterium]|nr:low molecular weight protein arginine phosphatase [Clostridia bacterium]